MTPFTNPVGTFEVGKNGYGLYGMAGNVWEWCYDWFPGSEGSLRVIHGGSWASNAYLCRAGIRITADPGLRGNTGLRAVLPTDQE